MRRRQVLSGVATALLVGTGGCTGAAGGGTRSTTSPPPATDPATGIPAATLVPREACPTPGDATVRLDADPVTVVGCVVGENGCTRPRLASVDREDGAVTVVVAAVVEADGDRACTQALVNLGYEVTLTGGEPPTSVTVVHDDVNGRRVVVDVTR
jgi:hypothetical protein